MRKRSKKPLIPAFVALLALGVWAEIQYSRPSPQTGTGPALSEERHAADAASAPSPSAASAAPRLTTQNPGVTPNVSRTLAQQPPTPAATPFAPPDEASLAEIDQVSLMLRDFRTMAGENPVGTNAEIMAAVMGANEKHATLGPPDGMKLNEKGELLDRWGTPYFFHQLSRDHMEIRSAGPDKVLWNEDDPVIR